MKKITIFLVILVLLIIIILVCMPDTQALQEEKKVSDEPVEVQETIQEEEDISIPEEEEVAQSEQLKESLEKEKIATLSSVSKRDMKEEEVIEETSTPVTEEAPKEQKNPSVRPVKKHGEKGSREYYLFGDYPSTEKEMDVPSGQKPCSAFVPKYAKKYGVDPTLMRKIIDAESTDDPYQKNKKSTASGCAQFIRSTWDWRLSQAGLEWDSPFNAELNVEVLAFTIKNSGAGDWLASENKWSK